MGVGPAGDRRSGARPGFRALVALADALGLAERSIGMSDDLEVAVEEGATDGARRPRPVRTPAPALTSPA